MPDSPVAPRQSWLTLGAASDMLGVSESTIRRWADAGDIRSFRTRGGHRRILEDDLQQFMASAPNTAPPRDTDRISDIALARVRRRISRGRQTHSMDALNTLSDDVRDRLRLIGRQVVDLFARYTEMWWFAFGTAILAGLMVFMLRENRTAKDLVPAAAH